MTSSHNKFNSYFNIAKHYKSKGNKNKYDQYNELTIRPDAQLPESTPLTPNASDNNLNKDIPEIDEIIKLYNNRRYNVLLKLASINPTHELLSYIAPSIHFATGNPEKAAHSANHIDENEERLLRTKTARMWHKLHQPLDAEPRVHLLVLTYNREKFVAQALTQLANTKYKNFAVYIADNGSSDTTWNAAKQAVTHFPDHVHVSMERLPTNIGRPAGHNWLLTKYDHSLADYIAIGDDDLTEVPPDWMTKMVQTAKAFPNSAVVGGKALYSHKPDTIHGCAHNIVEFSPRLSVSNALDLIDFGQFDYVDKVDHVTGCLHIYDRKILFDEVGLFDISLSPCQYVDVEHHLRVRLKGYEIIYNGFVPFRHMKAMGKESQKNRAMAGNALGNIIKVLHKHDKSIVLDTLTHLSEQRLAWLHS